MLRARALKHSHMLRSNLNGGLSSLRPILSLFLVHSRENSLTSRLSRGFAGLTGKYCLHSNPDKGGRQFMELMASLGLCAACTYQKQHGSVVSGTWLRECLRERWGMQHTSLRSRKIQVKALGIQGSWTTSSFQNVGCRPVADAGSNGIQHMLALDIVMTMGCWR